jgi:putative NADPH-quinone reductase
MSTKQEQIQNLLQLQADLFNPRKAPNKEITIQTVFREPEGAFFYHYLISKAGCRLKEGEIKNADCILKSDLDTWDKIGKGYLSGMKALRKKKVTIEKGFLLFIFRFNALFSGRIDYPLPDNAHVIYENKTDKIKKVLVLSCSPRGDKGITSLMCEKLSKGMRNKGAEVEIVYPEGMNINNCIGCIQCFKSSKFYCVNFHDDMNSIIDKFVSSDLVVWATPIYFFGCTALMKKILDRLCSIITPKMAYYKHRVFAHPLKVERLPYNVLLSIGGFREFKIFESTLDLFKIWDEYGGPKLLDTILRTTSMAFLIDDLYNKKMDMVLENTEKAGEELIMYKKIRRKTKRLIQRQLFSKPIFNSAANTIKSFFDKK